MTNLLVYDRMSLEMMVKMSLSMMIVIYDCKMKSRYGDSDFMNVKIVRGEGTVRVTSVGDQCGRAAGPHIHHHTQHLLSSKATYTYSSCI